jgi:hypothetical protein
MTVTYINMTSSYNQPSEYVNSTTESITRPIHNVVYANRPYRINDVSGLSYCIEKTDYVWLHYSPTDFVFEKVGDPSYKGPIHTNMEIFIKISSNGQYLYLNWFNYVKKQGYKENSTGKFVFRGK